MYRNKLRSALKHYPLLFKTVKFVYTWLMGIAQLFRLAVKSLYFPKNAAPQKVLCCVSNPAPFGGGELQFQQLVMDLKQRQLVHTVVSVGSFANDPDRSLFQKLKASGVDHIHIGNLTHAHAIAPRLVKYLLQPVLKRFKTPILHLFSLGGESLIPAAKAAGMTVIYSEPALPSVSGNWHWLTPQAHLIDHVTAVSQKSLEGLRNVCGYTGPAQIILPFIQEPGAQCRARAPVEGVFDIVHFGRMVEGKGSDLLIQAFNEVVKRHPYATLTMIGEGDRKKALQELVDQLHLKKSVKFHDFLKPDPLFLKIAETDVFCLPSFSEGTPCSILESMSIGLPVVATAVGGIPDVVADGETGFLVETNNVDALAKALISIAKDPALRGRMGANAKRIYEERYHKRRIDAQWMALYQSFHGISLR